MQSLKLSRNQLKLFAMLTMTLNHIAHIFEIEGIAGELLIGIGYFTAPCMCYFLVEGYYHTRSVKKYALRLFWLALISQLPYNLAFEGGLFRLKTFNMMVTLLFCLGICVIYTKFRKPGQFLIRIALIAMCVWICYYCDWYFMAPVMVLLLLMKREGRLSGAQAYGAMAVMYLYCNFINAWGSAALMTGAGIYASETILYTCLFLLFYMLGPCMVTWGLKHYDSTVVDHGSEGMKWFFYLYYPAHLLVLTGIHMLIM